MPAYHAFTNLRSLVTLENIADMLSTRPASADCICFVGPLIDRRAHYCFAYMWRVTHNSQNQHIDQAVLNLIRQGGNFLQALQVILKLWIFPLVTTVLRVVPDKNTCSRSMDQESWITFHLQPSQYGSRMPDVIAASLVDHDLVII